MTSCNADNNNADCPRTLSEALAFFLSRSSPSTNTILNSEPPSPRPAVCRNRESRIFQQIQLFENNLRHAHVQKAVPDPPASSEYSSCPQPAPLHQDNPNVNRNDQSMNMLNPNEPFYVNLQDAPPEAVLLRRARDTNVIKRKPMPNPRLSVQLLSPRQECPEVRVPEVPLVISPRRRSTDTPRRAPPPVPPPPPPTNRRSSVIPELAPLTLPALRNSQHADAHHHARRHSTLPGGIRLALSPTSPVSGLKSPYGAPKFMNEYSHPTQRPLPETPKESAEDDNYNDSCGDPVYQEIACENPNDTTRNGLENVVPLSLPCAAPPHQKKNKCGRKFTKNFHSLRGLPVEFDADAGRSKPRASSFTTADLVQFPPAHSSRSHSTGCSSILSLTESDSGVSLEVDSNRDDSSLLYGRYGVSLSSGEFQSVVEKVKGFQNRSESLNNDARVKNSPKQPHHDRNRRHTLPVTTTATVLDEGENDAEHSMDMISEIAHYPSRGLWCQQPSVVRSGILERLSEEERKLQEATYEIICSEASHLRSLNILINVFKNAPELNAISDKLSPGEMPLAVLSAQEERNLFLNITDIRRISAHLLQRLHKRWVEHRNNTGLVTLPDFSDILEDFATGEFKPYVNYCSNQLFQDRTLKNLKERRRFVDIVKRLEAHPACELLDFRSYLMLPMQRITRLPLLLSAVMKRLNSASSEFSKYGNALAAVNKVVKDCDEGAKRCACIEELCRIDAMLLFDVSLKKIPIISASRSLVKRGTVDMIQIEHKILPRRTFHKKSVHILLFNDLFVLTKPRSGSEETLTVMDYCPRNLLDCLPVSYAERDDLLAHTSVSTQFTTPDTFRGVKLVLLRNHAQKTVEFFVVMTLESDYMRWISVLNPSEKVEGDEKVYDVWDCPQYEILTDYEAKENDELNLSAGDVVDVYRKSSDGWMEGRRVRDGMHGWLPTGVAKELMTEHARARILKERNRLLVASAQFMHDRLKTTP
ncbi:rho guanine nucleotide exchange factor 16-like [Paramacrobiotus metropolitanus]|uniref:rho guanine nucleotide exchange factor 16-like n=1 Tax=Paramacrobiotus metropolitanus TaxID=2943436 RepID=UPI002445B9A4|nr:rho guanine nucleotide exchange factor 16-like [Paramacrobiotus metropolitanus]